ncbi:unnamed protein product [Brassica oleracea var. botrytis]
MLVDPGEISCVQEPNRVPSTRFHQNMTKERRQVKKLEVRPSRLVFSSLLEFVTFSRVNSSVIRTMSGLISSLGGSLSDLKLFLFFRHYLQDSCVKTSGTGTI